jgi:hypothetical protein
MIQKKFNNKNSTKRMKKYKRTTAKNYLWGGVL